MSLIKKAKIFATKAHEEVEQVRKYTNDPYIVHPAAVALKVSTVTSDPNVIAAAWLHDTVEDTNVTAEDIRNEFGDTVHDLVASLTDVSRLEDGNRKARRAIDLEHTRQASPQSKTVKLADLIDNSKSILKYSPDFSRVFIPEMENLLEVLAEGDATLYEEAVLVVENFKKG